MVEENLLRIPCSGKTFSLGNVEADKRPLLALSNGSPNHEGLPAGSEGGLDVLGVIRKVAWPRDPAAMLVSLRACCTICDRKSCTTVVSHSPSPVLSHLPRALICEYDLPPVLSNVLLCPSLPSSDMFAAQDWLHPYDTSMEVISVGNGPHCCFADVVHCRKRSKRGKRMDLYVEHNVSLLAFTEMRMIWRMARVVGASGFSIADDEVDSGLEDAQFFADFPAAAVHPVKLLDLTTLGWRPLHHLECNERIQEREREGDGEEKGA